MENKETIAYKDVINYGYCNSDKEYCVVLNSQRLKEIFKADKIYLEEPKEDSK